MNDEFVHSRVTREELNEDVNVYYSVEGDQIAHINPNEKKSFGHCSHLFINCLGSDISSCLHQTSQQ